MSLDTLSIREKNELVRRLRRGARPDRQETAGQLVELTGLQRQIWMAARLHSEVPLYWLPTLCRIEGAIDRSAFETGFASLLQSHDVLRMRIREVDSIPRLECRTPVPDGLEWVDLCDEINPDQTLAQWVERRKQQPPNPTQSLLDSALIKLTDTRYVWYLSLHHVIADGWTVELLVRDLARAYTAISCGAHGLSPVMRQPAHRNGEAGAARDTTFWQRVLGEEYDRTSFFGSGDPDPRKATRVRRISRTLSRARVARLTRWLENRSAECRHRLSPLDAAIATVSTYLYRVGTGKRISIGVPVHNRVTQQARQQVGCFADVYPLRVRLNGHDNVHTMLSHIRTGLAEIYAHTPHVIQRAADRPLYDCEVNYMVQQPLAFGDLPARLETVHTGYATVAMVLQVVEHRRTGELVVNLDCRADCFDPQDQRQTLSQLTRLMLSWIARPQRTLHTQPLLPAGQRKRLQQWNQTAYPIDFQPIPAFIDRWSQSDPDRIALQTADEKLTYRELAHRVDCAVAHLCQQGVSADSIVGVCFERSTDMMVTIAAVLKAGAAYLPLDPHAPTQRLAYMIQQAGSRLVLTSDALLERLAGVGEARKLSVDEWRHADFPLQEPVCGPHIDPRQGAYLIYTSGSTGLPKGVLVEHLGLFNRLEWMRRSYCLDAEQCFLQKTPYGFDVSVWEILLPFVCGARVVIARPQGHRDPRYLLDTIERYGVTACHFVPPMLREFVKVLGPGRCPTLRQIFCSGDVLTADLVLDLQKILGSGVRVHNLYGPTEASIDVTAWEARPVDSAEPIPIGKPIDNIQTWVLDESLNPKPIGTVGDLYLGGVGLARGYIGQPALTADCFRPDPFHPGARLYRTGDLARYRQDGSLEFLGRRDHQVKVRGVRIELSEIEIALAAHPRIAAVVVLARPHEAGDHTLCACIVPRGEPAIATADLTAHLRERLPDSLFPQSYVFLERIPTTTNGKIDRKALLACQDSIQASSPGAAAPRTDTERFLCNEWSRILGRGSLGLDDNFFEAGGHSLLVNTVLLAIERRFGPVVSFAELFQYTTVRRLAALIEARAIPTGYPPGPSLPVTSRDIPIPMSLTQRRFWYLSRLENGRALYNMSSAIVLTGLLNLTALERAVRELQRRHEILRSVYMTDETGHWVILHDEPCGEIHVARDVPDLQAAAHLAREEAGKPFDLTRDPLLRVSVLRLLDGRCVLVLTTHHIAADGWSMAVLFDELAQAYNTATADHGFEQHPPAPYQYPDFAHWQVSWMASAAATAEQEYWKRHLTGVELAELPVDFPRPPVQSHEGASIAFEIPAECSRKVKETAELHGASFFMVYLAALVLLLARLTGKRDVTVGTVVSGRNSQALQRTIGPLINTLVVRCRYSGFASVRELMAQIKRTVLEAFAHQTLPFEKVVAVCGIRPDAGRTPLFQVMFVYQDLQGGATVLDGLSAQLLPAEHPVAQFDLTWQIFPGTEPHSGNIVFNKQLFRQSTVQSYCDTWLEQLRLLVETDPDSAVPVARTGLHGLTPPTSEPEHRRPYEDVITAFNRAAACNPGATAVVHDGEALTYAMLDRRSSQLAAYLHDAGNVRTGQAVALCCDRSPQLLTAMLAVLKLGAAYVPIDPALPRERIDYVVTDSRACAIVTTRKHLDQCGCATALPIIVLDEIDLSSVTEIEPERPPIPSGALCYIVYTSGSTGRPKGVMVSHGGLSNLVGWFNRQFAVQPSDTATQVLGASFDGMVLETWPYLTRGASVHIVDREILLERERFRSFLVASQATVVFLPSATTRYYTADAWPAGSRVRAVLTGGERLVLSGQESADTPIYNLYGPTECTVVATCGQVSAGESLPSIGVPIDGTTVHILDDQLNVTPIGGVGEIYLAGVGLAFGYVGKPALTAAAFIPDPWSACPGGRLYRTGDLARRNPDGSISFVGRRDDQVSVHGYRVELHEVQSCLGRMPGVRQVSVLCHQQPGGLSQLIGFYSCHEGARVDPEDVAVFAARFLPDYMVPVRISRVPEIPLTVSGKVDRVALLQTCQNERLQSPDREPPRNEQERLVASVWEHLLGVGGIGIDEDFYALGGSSMTLLALQCQLTQRTGRPLPLTALMRAPTIRRQAALCIGPEIAASDTETLLQLETGPSGGIPVLLVHPPGGDVTCYAALAAALSSQHPVWALQDVRRYSELIEPMELDAWLGRYTEAIALHITGPVVLAGWSGGGLLCCELAARLRQLHREVAAVVLLDTRIPTGSADPDTLQLQIHYGAALILDTLSKGATGRPSLSALAALSADARIGQLAGRLTDLGLATRERAPGDARRLLALLTEHVNALYQLAAVPLDGPVIRLRATQVLDAGVGEDRDRALWEARVRGRYDEVEVQGDHLSILQPPQVQQTARLIRAALS